MAALARRAGGQGGPASKAMPNFQAPPPLPLTCGGGFGRRRRVRDYAGGVSSLRLTDLAVSGGCAAKYSAARLDELLRGFVPAEAEDLLVGLDPADDAAVYRLDDERALVFTLDFFPPLVDDPRDFGAIAATNALNDVFAMGGAPLLALSIAAFPEELPTEAVAGVLAGADEAVRAAGALLAGGHTIRDREPKYGLAVVGTVHPDGIWPKAGARPGDALYLTKPLGTGLVLHGLRRGLTGEAELHEAVRLMTTLNREAADALRPSGPSAVTDVTGFGLLGHAHEMARRSGVGLTIDASALPALPGALDVARAGERTGGDRRNREYAMVEIGPEVPDEIVLLAFDPQTAGGFLISLPAERGAVLEARFAAAGLFLARIGRVEQGEGVALA
jgi:selenide, water dikinase